MASVQDIVPCPQCGSDALRHFRTRDLSESISCLRCGYGETTRPIVDRIKQKTDPEHRAWFKTRKDGERICRTVKHVGRGAYRLELKKGGAVVGSVNCRVTPKMIANFKRDLANPKIDLARCYLTRWNPKRRCVEVVVGTLPRHVL